MGCHHSRNPCYPSCPGSWCEFSPPFAGLHLRSHKKINSYCLHYPFLILCRSPYPFPRLSLRTSNPVHPHSSSSRSSIFGMPFVMGYLLPQFGHTNAPSVMCTSSTRSCTDFKNASSFSGAGGGDGGNSAIPSSLAVCRKPSQSSFVSKRIASEALNSVSSCFIPPSATSIRKGKFKGFTEAVR